MEKVTTISSALFLLLSPSPHITYRSPPLTSQVPSCPDLLCFRVSCLPMTDSGLSRGRPEASKYEDLKHSFLSFSAFPDSNSYTNEIDIRCPCFLGDMDMNEPC